MQSRGRSQGRGGAGRGRGGGGSSRGRGGAGGRGRGGHKNNRAPRDSFVSAAVQLTSESMAEETGDFFSDLTGSRRLRPQQEREGSALAEQPVEGALVAPGKPLPGELLLANPSIDGAQQTQETVTWLELGLCKALVRAVSHLGYISPTPVQAACVPAALSGADVCARAVTGSGKTAAFLLPLADRLLTRPPQKATSLNSKRRFIRALVLVPTRELGVQCQEVIQQLLQFTSGLTTALAIGGVAPSAQEAALDAVPDILVATPGRLVDLIHNYKKGKGLDLSGVEVLVIDECDKMLTVTLKDQVEDIITHVPEETRQVLMLSATMTEEVDVFAKEHLFKPHNIDIGHVALQAKLRQQFVRVKVPPPEEVEAAASAASSGEPKKMREAAGKAMKRPREEEATEGGAGDPNAPPPTSIQAEQEHVSKTKSHHLVALCQNYFTSKTMIFCRYKSTAHRLAILFNLLELPAVEITGNQTQEERLASFERFSAGEVRYLITTDVASRGLDIKDVGTVINYDLPPTLTAYIHRVGRTARIGETGTAVSLVQENADADIMRKILAVSGAINDHQVSSVKRRDIPAQLLRAAVKATNRVFEEVRTQLQAEELEERIAQAEKRYGAARGERTFLDTLTARPKKEWCLSKDEQKRRVEEARQAYEREAEVTINHFQNQLSNLEREEMDILHKQKKTRRVEREKKAREQEKVKERARELRKKSEKKVNAGVVKKLKKRKIREAVREKRAENRAKKGLPAFKHGDGKKANKKSRHRKRMKRH